MTKTKELEMRLTTQWNKYKYNGHTAECDQCGKKINEYIFVTDDDNYPIVICGNCYLSTNKWSN